MTWQVQRRRTVRRASVYSDVGGVTTYEWHPYPWDVGGPGRTFRTRREACMAAVLEFDGELKADMPEAHLLRHASVHIRNGFWRARKLAAERVRNIDVTRGISPENGTQS